MPETGKSEAPAIDVRDIAKRFGRQVALDGVSFTLESGKCLVLFGPNGAGKTTLISLLSTLAAPSAGTALLCGRDVRRDSLGARRLLGVLSHESFLYEALTAVENLRFYAKMYGADHCRERLDGLLKDVGLLERADDPVAVMSRGMTQRLALARCMLHDPKVLLLDEPYSGLDPYGADILSERISGLCAANCAVMLTTHRLEIGLDVADHVAILVRGKLRYFADKGDLTREEFQREYARAVTEGTP